MSSIVATAPASMMLLGEHAVLKGHLSLVCAVNRHLKTTLTPRSDEVIYLHSQRIGELKTSLSELQIDPRFKFVTTLIHSLKAKLKTGFELNIEADFSHQVGLGSSAAVTSTTVTVFDRWLNPDSPFNLQHIFLKARHLVQSVQGLGSGADVAASIYGGTLLYRMEPLLIEKLRFSPPISPVYSGKKKPTVEVVQWLEKQREHEPTRIDALFSQIEESILKAKILIEQQAWHELGQIFDLNQHYMNSLGLSTPLLDELIQQLRECPNIHGAKISGSGMGDCIIGLGKLASTQFPRYAEQEKLGVQQFNLEIINDGIRYATE